jgi:hypothetical protein
MTMEINPLIKNLNPIIIKPSPSSLRLIELPIQILEGKYWGVLPFEVTLSYYIFRTQSKNIHKFRIRRE